MNRLRLFFYLVLIPFTAFACQQTGSAPKLQSHLAAAKTSSAQTQTHVESIKTHLDTADYKGSRAKKLLDQGIEKPE
jgi:outer membrane lipoprotein-sorting protein